jgi:hypothetical protein
MGPGPAASLLWTLIDVALCRYSVLHPIYYLVESTLLMCLNVGFGVISVMFSRCATAVLNISQHALTTYNSWDSGASWVPGMFIIIAGVL